MNDIPFPIPLSVIRSPNHNTNILPAANMIVDVIINITPSGKAALPICVFKLTKYEGAWIRRIATVK